MPWQNCKETVRFRTPVLWYIGNRDKGSCGATHVSPHEDIHFIPHSKEVSKTMSQTRTLWRILTAVLVVALIAGAGLVIAPNNVWAGNQDQPLYQYQTYGQCSDTEAYQVAVAGVGMYGASTGTINLSLPGTATVVKAYLYWTGRDPYGQGSPYIQFEGSTFHVGDAYTEKIGGPAFWATNDFAYAYRADVTSLVSPSKTSYTFADPYSGDPDQFNIPYGAALVVIYQDSAVTTPTIVETWEGMDIAEGTSGPGSGPGTDPVTFTFNPAAVDRTLHLSTVVGGVTPGSNATLYYLMGTGTPPTGDIYNDPSATSVTITPAADGHFMTTQDNDITIPAGTEWLKVQVVSEDTGGPQLHWLAETFQMEAACPKVQVTKTLVTPAGGLAHVGDTVTFQIQIQNTGNTTLEVVPLQDTYDKNYLSFGGVASPSPDDSNDDGTLNWLDITTDPGIGDLNPGDTKTVTVSFTAINGTQSLTGDVTTNTATVSGATDQNGNSPPDDSDSADVEISNPSMAISKDRAIPTPPDQIVTVGETIKFTITVTNTGDTVLSTVPLTDTYDTTYFQFLSATPSSDDSIDDGQLNWSNIGPLNPGQSTTVVVEFRAKQSTWDGTTHQKVHNYAEASATDENGETVGPVEDTDFVRITNPAVSISKQIVGSDYYVPIGGQITYHIVVQNTGDTVLDVVPVVDTFPSTYLAYHSDTSGYTPSVVGNTITWSDVTGTGSLAVGGTIEFDVTFDVIASSNPNPVTNTACVQGATDENGDHPSDVCDEDNNGVTTNPEITITKVRVTTSPVLVGDAVQFQITIQNTGDTAIDVLPLTDTFDATKLQFDSASPSPDNTGTGSLTWNDLTGSSSLAPGGSVVVTVNFIALASTTPGTTTNTATVSGATDEHGDTVPTASDSDDVAILAPASIGNYVWEDTNGNGIQDTGENGIDNVTVELYDSSDNLVATATTSGGGYYHFTHLFPGDYYVKFYAPTGYAFTAQDQGTDDTADSDANPTTGKTAVTTLTEGEDDLTWDAGLYRPVTIGDYVWEDMNGNGIQDDGSTGISGVTVNLYYAGPDGTFGTSDDDSFSTTTGLTGNYSFTNLPPGNYKVEFVTPAGYVITFQDQGTDDAQDSDADRTSGMTAPFSVDSGQSDLTRDAGMYRPVSIGDWVWEDTDGDGVQDVGETGIDGVPLELYDSSNNLISTTTSAGGGYYSFDNLPPGTYTVKVPGTHGSYVHTTPTSQTRTLQSGQSADDADFGYIYPTAVDLMEFQAEVGDAGVHLTWRTRSEAGVAGFWVQRASVRFGPWQNVLYVPAQGSGSTYSVYDSRVQPGFTYYYRLVTAPEGQSFGPWAVYVPKTWDPGAGIQSGHRLFVPMISR